MSDKYKQVVGRWKDLNVPTMESLGTMEKKRLSYSATLSQGARLRLA